MNIMLVSVTERTRDSQRPWQLRGRAPLRGGLSLSISTAIAREYAALAAAGRERYTKRVMDWEKLAEAKIREWQERSPAERVSPQPAGPVEPLEVQLLKEALHCRALAQNAATDAERSQLARRAAEAETRLLVLLESSGRPLAARRIADMLAGVPRP